MKSYLLSSLSFRFSSAEEETFSRAFSHDWLLWEPGAWKAPASTTHLLTMRGTDKAWTVRDANSRNGTKLDGLKLEPGKPLALVNGSRLIAAQVSFTYYNTTGMLARLKGL